MTYKKRLGDKGEEIAADFLLDKGYQILERNYFSRYGEIDLVAQDFDAVVFVEVKTRRTQSFGSPEASVTPAKLERIQKAGLIWLRDHPDSPENWRVEVISIMLDARYHVQEIRHFVDI